MNRHEQNRLLKEILQGEELASFREVSLNRTLAAVQQRRRQRNAIRAGALAALPVLVIALVLLRSSNPFRGSTLPGASGPVAGGRTVNASQPESVEVISDQELFALFPGRQMALIGKPGHQQLVFLD